MYFNAVAVGPANCPSLRSTTARSIPGCSVCSLSYLEPRPREKSTDNLRKRICIRASSTSYPHPRRTQNFGNKREVLIGSK